MDELSEAVALRRLFRHVRASRARLSSATSNPWRLVGRRRVAFDPGSLDCQPETKRVHGRPERKEQGHRPTLGIKQENLHHRRFALEFREGNTLDWNREDERRWSKQT